MFNPSPCLLQRADGCGLNYVVSVDIQMCHLLSIFLKKDPSNLLEFLFPSYKELITSSSELVVPHVKPKIYFFKS